MDLHNTFVIATGRSYLDFYNKLNKYKFKYNYVILNHGTTIIDNNIISDIKNDLRLNLDIKNDLNILNCENYFCCSGYESRLDFDHNDLTKINVKYKDLDTAMDMVSHINKKYSKYVKAYYVNNFTIEIISNKIDKKEAIYYLIKNIVIDKNNVYTIGDGYSDIEMIKEFNRYCMKNSVSLVKEVSINEYDSVSIMIKDILNENI